MLSSRGTSRAGGHGSGCSFACRMRKRGFCPRRRSRFVQGGSMSGVAGSLALTRRRRGARVLSTAARRGSRPTRASPSPIARPGARDLARRDGRAALRTTAWWVTCAARRRARPCGVSPTSRLRPSAGLVRRSTRSIFASRSTDLETPLGECVQAVSIDPYLTRRSERAGLCSAQAAQLGVERGPRLEHRAELLGRQRAGEQVTLSQIATQCPQLGQLRGGFDPLGDHGQG